MNNTIFTDYGIVRYKSFFDDVNHESNIDDYLNDLTTAIKDKSNNYLVYESKEDKLYTICGNKKRELVLTNSLKNELNNNEDTNFNRTIRELLEFSEIKRKYYILDKIGSFDSVEEADCYARFLEEYESIDDLDEIEKIKLSGAREYIKNKAGINSDVYKYHASKENETLKKRIKNEITKLSDDKVLSENVLDAFVSMNKSLKISSFIIVAFGILLFFVMSALNVSIAVKSILTVVYFVLGGFLEVNNIDEIKDNNIIIKSYNEKIDSSIEEINELNKKEELIKSKEEKKEKKENSFYSELEIIISNLNDRADLLDNEDRIEAKGEIINILSKYKEDYRKLVGNSNNENSFVAYECLVLNTNLLKSLKKLSEIIEYKIEVKNNIDELDVNITRTNSSLNSQEKKLLKR